jgi:hypothetical protein
MGRRWSTGLLGAVAACALVCTLTLGQAQGFTEVAGSAVSFDQAFGSVGTDISAQDLEEAGIAAGDLVELRMSGHVIQIPVVSEMFPCLPQSLPGVIVWGNAYIVGWYTNIAAEYVVALGDEITVRLIEKGGYLDEIAEREVHHVERRDECSSDEEYANFREVSTGTIQDGVLFRSSHPADGSDRSAYAHALMVQAGVRTIINVGASWNDPQQAYDNSDYYEARGGEGAVLATNIGLAVTWPHFQTELAKVLRFMIDHEPPYLIHCSLGQDRAGLTSAVLEALAGADLQDVIDDYALTFANYYRIEPDHALYSEVVEQLLSKFREMNGGSDVTSENLQSAVTRYLTTEAGLTESEIELLQERLSVSSPTSRQLEESDGQIVWNDFEDGDMTTKACSNWHSYAEEEGSLASPPHVEQGEADDYLALEDSSAGLIGVETEIGEIDLSGCGGIYAVISASQDAILGATL